VTRLNKPGSHVMLFLRFTPDRKAEVMESSTGGCNGRVCRNVYPLARSFGGARYVSQYGSALWPRTKMTGCGECLSGGGTRQPGVRKAGHGKAVNLVSGIKHECLFADVRCP